MSDDSSVDHSCTAVVVNPILASLSLAFRSWLAGGLLNCFGDSAAAAGVAGLDPSATSIGAEVPIERGGEEGMRDFVIWRAE